MELFSIRNSGFNFADRCGNLIKNIDNLINDLIKIKDSPQKIIGKLSNLKKQKIDLIKKSREYLTLGFYNTPPAIYGNLSSYYPEDPSKQPILFCGNCGQPIKIRRDLNKKKYSDLYGRLVLNGGLPYCGNYSDDVIDDRGCWKKTRNVEKLHEVNCSKCTTVFQQQKHKSKDLCPNCMKKLFSRVSPLEKKLGENLMEIFKDANILFKFSDRETLYVEEENDRKGNSVELDIIILGPEDKWKAAIEVNGAHHYNPIWAARGKTPEERLEAIKERDIRKQNRCRKQHIDLLILNIGSANYSSKLLNNATEIAKSFINEKIAKGISTGDIKEIVV